jgi:hypothetical protein
MSAAIPNLDNLFRGAHYPWAFSSKTFKPLKFMKLYPNEADFRIIEASFIWERYAPTFSHVHSCGCSRSKKRKKKDIYCGAYQIKAASVRELMTTKRLPEVATADIVHLIEEDEISHASLRVRLRDDVEEEEAEDVKTAIADRLWNASSGPLPHTCRADRDLAPHPNAYLEKAPLGLYADDRSIPTQIWYVARYWFVYAIWKMHIVSFNGR